MALLFSCFFFVFGITKKLYFFNNIFKIDFRFKRKICNRETINSSFELWTWRSLIKSYSLRYCKKNVFLYFHNNTVDHPDCKEKRNRFINSNEKKKLFLTTKKKSHKRLYTRSCVKSIGWFTCKKCFFQLA